MIPTESEPKRESSPSGVPDESPASLPEPTSESPQEIEEPLDIGRAPLESEPIKVDPEPALLLPKATAPSQETTPPLTPLPPPQDTYQPNQSSIQPDDGYGLVTDSKNFDATERFGEVQPSAPIPKIVTTDRQPITTMRTKHKKQTRTAATLLLGMATIFLLLILFLVLYLNTS